VAFLKGQVDAFLPILRSDTGISSLAAAEETAMLVNILYQILRTRNSAVSILDEVRVSLLVTNIVFISH
jgi:hypothetical protein